MVRRKRRFREMGRGSRCIVGLPARPAAEAPWMIASGTGSPPTTPDGKEDGAARLETWCNAGCNETYVAPTPGLGWMTAKLDMKRTILR